MPKGSNSYNEYKQSVSALLSQRVQHICKFPVKITSQLPVVSSDLWQASCLLSCHFGLCSVLPGMPVRGFDYLFDAISRSRHLSVLMDCFCIISCSYQFDIQPAFLFDLVYFFIFSSFLFLFLESISDSFGFIYPVGAGVWWYGPAICFMGKD